MDDIAVLRACRPEPEPASAAERTEVQEQLMSLIAPTKTPDREGPAEPTVDPIAPRRANRRRRRVAMVAVAATVAAVVGIAGLALRGPGPLATPPVAADQLRAIADATASASPYPASPYAVAHRRNPPLPGATSDRTVYTLAGGDTLTTVNCKNQGPPTGWCGPAEGDLGPPPPIVVTGAEADIRASAEQWLAAQANRTPGSTDRSRLVFELINQVLGRNDVGGEARSVLLHLAAETPGLEAEPGVANAFGRVGTRFSIDVPQEPDRLTGSPAVLIDPADGYLLGYRMTYRGATTNPIPATSFEDSWDRPVANPELPAAGAQLAADLVAHHTAIESGLPESRCLLTFHALDSSAETLPLPKHAPGETWNYEIMPPSDNNTFGVTVPEGWAFTHCW